MVSNGYDLYSLEARIKALENCIRELLKGLEEAQTITIRGEGVELSNGEHEGECSMKATWYYRPHGTRTRVYTYGYRKSEKRRHGSYWRMHMDNPERDWTAEEMKEFYGGTANNGVWTSEVRDFSLDDIQKC